MSDRHVVIGGSPLEAESQPQETRRVEVFDTTLRDGSQLEGI